MNIAQGLAAFSSGFLGQYARDITEANKEKADRARAIWERSQLLNYEFQAKQYMQKSAVQDELRTLLTNSPEDITPALVRYAEVIGIKPELLSRMEQDKQANLLRSLQTPMVNFVNQKLAPPFAGQYDTELMKKFGYDTDVLGVQSQIGALNPVRISANARITGIPSQLSQEAAMYRAMMAGGREGAGSSIQQQRVELAQQNAEQRRLSTLLADASRTYSNLGLPMEQRNKALADMNLYQQQLNSLGTPVTKSVDEQVPKTQAKQTVTIQTPEGKKISIPRDKLQEALGYGATEIND